MELDSKISYIKLVFSRILDDDKRLNRGYELRKEMIEIIKRGEEPEGYRPDWIRTSALHIVSHLRDVAYDFNLKYGDDKASVDDMVDILNHAINLIKRKR